MSRVTGVVQKLHHRLGLRGDVLLTLAVIDFVYGWTLITASPSVLDTNLTFKWINSVAPLAYWGATWWLVGLICAVNAFRHNDRAGWVSAWGIKVLWGLLCLGGWAIESVSLGSVAIWLGYARIIWRLAGLTEPEPTGDDAS